MASQSGPGQKASRLASGQRLKARINGIAMIRALLVVAAITAPIAVTLTAPTSSVIFADDQCGDGYEWSKTIGRCIPVPTAAPTAPPGATFQCVDGDYS